MVHVLVSFPARRYVLAVDKICVLRKANATREWMGGFTLSAIRRMAYFAAIRMYVCGTENGKIVVGAGSWDNINFKWQWDLFCIFTCHSIPCLVSQIPLHSFQVFRFSCCQVVGLSGLILGA